MQLDSALLNQAKAYALYCLFAGLVFIAFWIAGALISRLIRALAPRTGPDREGLVILGSQCAKIAVRIFGAVTALGTLGVDVSALVAGLGLTGFAVGFALKDALSNVLAGAMILFYQPFQRGAYISVAGLEGLVRNIDLRYTTLDAPERVLLLPNSTLLTNPIIVHGAKRQDVVIPVSK